MSFCKKLPEEFQLLYNTWTRLEPRCRTANVERGLEARTADPLWLLGRQCQLGECQGQDAGSPVGVQVTYSSGKIASLSLPNGDQSIPLQGNNGSHASIPLEALIEAEPIQLNWRTRVKLGQQFERLLAEQISNDFQDVIDVLRKSDNWGMHPSYDPPETSLDDSTIRFLAFMEGRALDGAKLRDKVPFDEEQELTNEQKTAVLAARDQWNVWYEQLYYQPQAQQGSGWEAEELAYRAKVATDQTNSSSMELGVPSYRNGDLEWYHFTTNSEVPQKFTTQSTVETIAVQLDFPGMPHTRWWAFEDRETHFGNLTRDVTGLAHLMMMQFGLLYADDWFVIPLELEHGTVTKIDKLIVTNVFGDKETLLRAETPGEIEIDRWDLFSLSGAPSGDFLFLPPAIGLREESLPIEEVRFLRDEGANLVWAVEDTVQNQLGRGVQGFEIDRFRNRQSRPNPDNPGNGDGNSQQTETPPPLYRLASTVPANWIPFVPVNMDENNFQIKLRQARMLRNEEGEETETIEPMSRILGEKNPQDETQRNLECIREETIPRSGIKVQLTKQRVRWINGETYVWWGRKVVPGQGEGSSGLRWDWLRMDGNEI